jgi:lipoyl(octanoyl) transferase
MKEVFEIYKLVRIKNHVDYLKGLELQKKAVGEIQVEKYKGIVFLLEHKPVYTLGVNAFENNILIPEQELIDRGVSVHKTNRGGDITYHGPGQIVGYPIINLKYFQKDLRKYIRMLEETIINTLDKYDITAGRKSEYVGVWVDNVKIAAIGCNARKWISTHGFALNVRTDMEYFDFINPCGIKEFGVDSMKNHISDILIEDVKDNLSLSFQEVFNIEFDEIEEVEVD